MPLILSSQNIKQYLLDKSICGNNHELNFEKKSSKNFNLLITLTDNNQILVKQERYHSDGKTGGTFLQEWTIYQWLKNLIPDSHIIDFFTEVLDFDSENSIMILKYLHQYSDLKHFYESQKKYSPNIAYQLGCAIASIHRITFDSDKTKQFFIQNKVDFDTSSIFLSELEEIYPVIFSKISKDNIKFYKLYQRSINLQKAIKELQKNYEPRCLIHNDLNFNNILIHNQWQDINSQDNEQESIIKIIDWELFTWGDPALDLGNIIANYLNLWLSSFVISSDIDIQTALSLAMLPLEKLQSSIIALIKSYIVNFPEIFTIYPDFLNKTMQFTGVGLIEKIQADIYYHQPFDNHSICMLQVASTLLCYPEKSIQIVCGKKSSEFE